MTPKQEPPMTPKTSPPELQLETTGQYLEVPLLAAHDNEKPSEPVVERSLKQLDRVSGH
jgi:hypothetical protein